MWGRFLTRIFHHSILFLEVNMIKLEFTPSNIGCFYIVDASDGKRYVIDNSSVSNKEIVWGLLPKQITTTAYELSKNNSKFEYEHKSNIKDRGKVLTVIFLPIIGGVYRGLSSLFQSNNDDGQIIKMLFFVLSLLAGYVFIKVSIFFSRKKALRRLGGNPRKFRLNFKTNEKRNFIGVIFPLLNFLCFLLFWFVGDGSEVFFLILNSVFAMLSCVVSVAAIPVQLYYERKTIDLVSIEEVK